ncbi:DNRLRE domain-containing protein [Streptomyces sp. NPDC057927]
MMTEEYSDSLEVLWVSQHKNKMDGIFNIYGNVNSDLNSSIISRAGHESELASTVTIRVDREKHLNSTLKLMYKDQSQISSYFTSTSLSLLDSFLKIRPHNSMYGIFDILEPSRINDKLNPIKDATTRSIEAYKYLNYGKASQMMIGNNDGDIQRSFLDFDLSQYSDVHVIEKAKLRLYYSGMLSNTNSIELALVDRTWNEINITDANRPLHSTVISNEYEINTLEQYIEFDIFDTVNATIKNEIDNFGFVLQSNNIENGLSDTFFTRESHRQPYLDIVYYDTRVWTTGKSELKSTLLTVGIGNKDLNSTFELKTDWDKNDLLSTLFIHRYDTPVWTEINATIRGISRPNISAKMTVARHDNNDLLGVLKIRKNETRDYPAKIIVSKPELHATVYTKYYNEINGLLNIRIQRESKLSTQLIVNKPELVGRFITRIQRTNELTSVLHIKQSEKNEVISKLIISRPEIRATLTTKAFGNSDLNGNVLIYGNEEETLETKLTINTPELNGTLIAQLVNDIDGQLGITKPEVKAVLTGRAIRERDLNSFLRPKVLKVNDLNSQLQISNKHMVRSYFYIL